MESAIDNDNIPQWKKDLIARLRNQNKSTSVVVASSKDQQLCTFEQHQQQSSVRHLNSSWKNDSVPSGASNSEQQCDVNRVSSPCSPVKKIKMVQERYWVEPKITDMVNENFNNNGYRKDEESDSSEDLQYGPGIVKKLKNKYLSLALRESNNRPSIMHMRKATSLENLLDDDIPKQNNENKHFQSRLNGNDTGKMPSSNRYHRRQIRGEMKRARSVETISRFDNNDVPLPDMRNNRQSLHEDMLIAVEKEGNDATTYMKNTQDNAVIETNLVATNRQRINRPKRIQPIMNEKEKPPADVVKHAKMIFEKRPEQRTKKPPPTGEVAAKVDSFNSIIVKAKVEAKIAKKPPVKHSTKPVLNDKNKGINRPAVKTLEATESKPRLPKKKLELNKTNKVETTSLPSPIPDVSRIDFHNNGEHENTNLTETPDLILTSSPLQSSPVHKKISTENFLREEIRNTSPVPVQNGASKKITSPLVSPNRVKPASPLLSPSFIRPLSPHHKSLSPTSSLSTPVDSDEPDSPAFKLVSPSSIKKISSESTSVVYNFTEGKKSQSHLPVNSNVSIAKTPPSQPLKIDVNGHTQPKLPQPPVGPASPKLLQTQKARPRSPPKFSPPPPPKVEKKPEKSLTVTEVEKNSINTAKTLQPSVSVNNASVEVVNINVVPKKLKPRETSSNTSVFNFTKRKDVPDYISNDTSRTTSRPELPKPGEGGIILIPGATILDSFIDEDEEILRSLEGPPSPCNVTFINDNILIDGKSSLCQKTKRAKLKISFVEEGPEIFEYPSETSLLLDDSPVSVPQASVGHTVPTLGGSYLANYTPKTTGEFEPGVTRSVQQSIPNATKPDITEVDDMMILQEIERPFSSGNNTDILF